MIVWLNTDGSIGEIVSSYALTDSNGNAYSAFSQREGNLAAGGIFVYFEGGNPSGGLAYSAWTLPTGSVSPTAYKASWKRNCTIALDKSRDMRKFKAEKAYEMQYFPFPDGLISEGGNGVYKVGITDSIDGETYAYGPVLFSVAENSVVKETTLTKTEYAELKADLESKADKSTLQADYQLQYSDTNVRGYAYGSDLDEDIANMPNYQIALYSKNDTGRLNLGWVLDGKMTDITLDVSADYVTKSASLVSVYQVQEVPSGLWSTWDGGDDGYIYYGTNNDGSGYFEAQVYSSKPSSKDYPKNVYSIFLRAPYFEFKNDQGVNIFEDDGNAVYLRSSNGTSTITFGSGSAQLSAYSFQYIGNNVFLDIDKSLTIESKGGAVIDMDYGVEFKSALPYSSIAPTEDAHFANKKYVDGQDSAVKDYALGLMNESHDDLQEQIDAINESQNFVATYATKADMPTPPISTLEEKDCVLVLKDESHDDQAYVYKYNSAGWVEVGPLGDYYTTAQIDKQHSAIEAKITALGARVDDIAKIAWRQW